MKNTFHTWKLLMSVVAVAAIGSMSTALAGDDIAVSDLPSDVSKAVKERFPTAELIKAEKETDEGQLKYEVKIRTEGKLKEAHVSPEGKILKVEDEDDN